ncbi:RING-type E3 ubiquitin transferase [Trifolium repens]|nr:RING-type E3 ubiquitin transferase [Trifolium repens]
MVWYVECVFFCACYCYWKSLAESLQAGRANVAKREKELKLKLESTDNARHILDSFDSGTDELELQLQKCIIERNDLELTLEEAKQDTGRKDIKVEFRVMASALSKEMGMMEAQLKRWKDAALEAVSLREKAHSLRATLSGKIEKLQQENQELEFVLDMYGSEDYQKRGYLYELRNCWPTCFLDLFNPKNDYDDVAEEGS